MKKNNFSPYLTKRYSKYNNQPVEKKGKRYDSKREERRYSELQLMERAGKIEHLERQIKFELIPRQLDENGKVAERACSYIADFVYRDCETGKIVVEDCKGFRTTDYIIKRKLMRYKYGIAIKET